MYGGLVMKKEQKYINDLLAQYRDGSITDKDRHHLERLALDDPFLFDSLEGYATNTNANTLSSIQKIRSKTGTASGRIVNMRWVSMAAGIAILVGGLFWANSQLNDSTAKEHLSNVVEKEVLQAPQRDNSDYGAIAEVSEDTEILNEKSNAIIQSETIVDNTITTASSSGTESSSSITQSPILDVVETDKEEASLLDEKTVDDSFVNEAIIAESTKEPTEEINKAETNSSNPSVEKSEVAQEQQVIAPSAKVTATSSTKEEMTDASELSGNIRSKKLQRLEKKPNATPNRIITGVVRDITGEPLIGANIQVPDSQIGVSTDFDGSFSIELDSSINNLQIAYVGFEALIVELDTSSSYDLILDEGMALDEVVVAGYNADVNVSQLSFVLPPEGRSDYKEKIKKKSLTGCDQSGKVRLKFTVTKYGEVTDFEIKRGLSELCNQRAIEIIKDSGRWNNQFNKDKKVRYTISF